MTNDAESPGGHTLQYERIIKLTLKGIPLAKMRSRKGGNHWYNPQSVEMERDRRLLRQQLPVDFYPAQSYIPVVVNTTWFFPPNKVEMKQKKFLDLIRDETYPYIKKPDLDNLDKYIKDIMSGLIYFDDKQIYGSIINKFYTIDNPRAEIEVMW